MKEINIHRPYQSSRPISPWREMASSVAKGNDELAQKIEECLSFAFLQGFQTADANPRQPESMGR